MNRHCRNVCIGFGWFLLWLPIGAAAADTIFLKDGSSVEAERVWQTDKFVHFILSGTKTVEVRYHKSIVARITSSAAPTRGFPEKHAGSTSALPPGPESPAKSIHSAPRNKLPDQEFIAAVKGIEFYDPQRREKYWAAPDARHNDLQSALEALAVRYDRSIDWVSAHMGEENELANIHSQLMARYQSENRAGGAGSMAGDRSGALGEDQTRGAPPQVLSAPQTLLDEFEGLTFYEPRRAQKYWTARGSHHTTLNEALSALAARYGVTPQWIADHMGETNDLRQVHQNIYQGLTAP